MNTLITFAPFRLLKQRIDRLAVVLVNSPPSAEFPSDWKHIWNGAQGRICTDGAANRLLELCSSSECCPPELIVGDLDSLDEGAHQYFAQCTSTELRKEADQDSTDLTKALKALAEMQTPNGRFSAAVLLGGLGGRFDHTLGVLHSLLLHTQQHSEWSVFALDAQNVATVLGEGSHRIELSSAHITGVCGLFPLAQRCTRVSTEGFQWNLDNTELEFGRIVSSSNHATRPHDLHICARGGPVVFTFELREPNHVL